MAGRLSDVNCEPCTLALTTLDANGSTMSFHHGFDVIESQPIAFDIMPVPFGYSVEAFEDVWQRTFGDAYAMVGDDDFGK